MIVCDIFQFLLLQILGQVKFHIWIHGRLEAVTLLHAESFVDCGDIGYLTKTESGTIFITVDHDAEELACRPEVGDFVLL